VDPLTILRLIKRPLLEQNVLKIVLFGSHSKGTAADDSDIDLLVVTNDNFIPSSFSEKMAVKMPIANALYNLRQYRDIDLLVYTKPMYEQFLEQNSGLKKEIESTGAVIYEAGNT
jgi:uncharacterized protein